MCHVKFRADHYTIWHGIEEICKLFLLLFDYFDLEEEMSLRLNVFVDRWLNHAT